MITYTNRKGVTYTLCKDVTKTGKPRYFFAREPQGELCEFTGVPTQTFKDGEMVIAGKGQLTAYFSNKLSTLYDHYRGAEDSRAGFL